MKTPLLAAVLISLSGTALAQVSFDQRQPGGTSIAQAQPMTRMPMGQMVQGQGMHGGMMGGSMTGGPGRGLMGRFSVEDMSAFIDAHIAAIHAGLKLTPDQEKLWPPVEAEIRHLAIAHLGHMQAMRQARAMMARDPIGLLRGMADHMSQGADSMRKLADTASPLHATLDEAQRRRLQVLVHMGSRGMMGGMRMPGMMGPGRAMMPGGSSDDDEEEGNR